MSYCAETILVVEDAEAVRKMVCAMLRQTGYNCLEAVDGPDALRVLDETSEAVQLVLTDMVMPKMSGADLARRIARLRPELRIVFMSGYADEELIRSVEHATAIFLRKPFTAGALGEIVRSALDRPWSGLPEITAAQ